MQAPGSDDATTTPVAPNALWLLVLLVAVVELIALPVRLSRVARPDDWRAAAQLLRGQRQACDAIEVAPSWAGPWLRWALGDALSFGDVSRGDLDDNCRLWTLSIRGHDSPSTPPNVSPELDRMFGRVRVRRWTLPKPRAGYDFVAHVREATVSRVVNGQSQPCPWQVMPAPRGGGLGVGALFPTERFVCDARRPWLFVAPLVLEDLDLQPRHCLWQHPQGNEPIVTRFDAVTLQDELVFEGGLYYEHERDRVRPPVHVRVRFDDEDAARMIHTDGDGYKRMVIDTRARKAQRVAVSVEVSAPAPHFRTFCWSGHTRTAEAEP